MWVFTIFIFMQNKGQNETQVKLIRVTYWIKLLLVTQVQCMIIMVYMNVLQFDVCSNCCLLVYWLPTYWEIYEMQYLGYLSVQRYNSVNSFSTAHPVVFQMPLLMPHGMCRIHACCSLHLFHHVLELWGTTATKVLIVERRMHLWGAVSAVGRESAMLLRQTLIGAAASTQRLLVHN